jgi:hypothetical protein
MSNVICLYKKLSDLNWCAQLEEKVAAKAPTKAAGQEAANAKWAHMQVLFERCHEHNKPANKKVG